MLNPGSKIIYHYDSDNLYTGHIISYDDETDLYTVSLQGSEDIFYLEENVLEIFNQEGVE